MFNVIELEGGLKVAELSRIEYEGTDYLFVASLTEEPSYVFLQAGEKKRCVSIVEDETLLLNLMDKVKIDILEYTKKLLEKYNNED